ncbi:uncharacterized protein LOC123514007 [Portunus trituberculatus]|uniref:uncharacterized protein LOC123514007 n=1 Tax=Portunus trituberculatus TaxID=210409 RepID=UPI001E1CCC5A|nr:uncharacterized protein LOC123514007 [Portunus trituberculatus]
MEYQTNYTLTREESSSRGSSVSAVVCLASIRPASPPLRPQSDGMVKIVHQLAKYCHDDQHDWEVWMPYVFITNRSAEHEATGFPRAKLMFGREISLPIDLFTGRPPGAELPNDDSDCYDRTAVTRRGLPLGEDTPEGSQAMWRCYLGRARNAEYQPGDLAWLYSLLGKSPKFQPDWEGPYNVGKVISAVNYRLEIPHKKRTSKIVHVDRLWKHPGEGEFTWGVCSDVVSSDNS